MKNKVIITIIGIVLIVLGFSTVYFGVRYQNNLEKNGIKTTGRVASYSYIGNKRQYLISYQTKEGKSVQFAATSVLFLNINSQVNIIYDPNNLAHAEVDNNVSSLSQYGFYLIFGIVAFLLGVLCLFIVIKGKLVSVPPSNNEL